MTYSCPIWNETSPDVGESLKSAQLRELYHIIHAANIQAANIQATDHILEIGTG